MPHSTARITRRQATQALAALALAPTARVQAAETPRQLTVAAFPAVDKIIEAAKPAWARQHPGVTLQVVSRQFVDHHNAMTTALSTRSHLPDVMALEVGYVGRFAQGGGLENLAQAPYEFGRVANRFVPYAVQQATHRNGAVVAVPTDIGPGTLLVRSDILAKAGVSDAELTHSWDSYVAAGLKVKQATGAYLVAHARDIKDIAIRTGIQPGEGLYFDKDGQVLVKSPRFTRAFELARQVRSNKLDAKVVAWSNEWSEGFKRGSLTSQLTGAWLAGHLGNWLAPKTAGLWRALPLPAGAYAAYGGTFLAIARGTSAARKLLAWDLIQLLTMNHDMQLAAFKSQDAFPALLSTHNDPFFEQPLPFLGGQTARLMWRQATQHIQAVTVHKQDAFAAEVIDTELDKVLDHAKPIATALADAARVLEKRAHR
jgi:multiple sugar transport system substrate-binding protein